MLIFDGFYRLGHYKFGYVKITTLVIQVFISFLSLLLVWSYHHEQNGHITKWEKGSGWRFFKFKKPTRRE
jgi:Ni,Fe-hydrogenase I cytochrome b subunit